MIKDPNLTASLSASVESIGRIAEENINNSSLQGGLHQGEEHQFLQFQQYRPNTSQKGDVNRSSKALGQNLLSRELQSHYPQQNRPFRQNPSNQSQSRNSFPEQDVDSSCQEDQQQQEKEEEGQGDLSLAGQELQLIIQYRQKISDLTEKIITLEQKIFYYEEFNQNILEELLNTREKDKQQSQKIHEQGLTIKALADKIKQLQDILVPGLRQKICNISSQRDSALVKLSRALDSNEQLEKQLMGANKKILQLEKEVQVQAFKEIQTNMIRIGSRLQKHDKPRSSQYCKTQVADNENINYSRSIEGGGLSRQYVRRYESTKTEPDQTKYVGRESLGFRWRV